MEKLLGRTARLSGLVFMPVRRLAGPLHRRRSALKSDPNARLPPLPAPWKDPRWFRGDFPPRLHNDVRPLLHGDEYFGDLYPTLLAAQRRVTIAGWCLTPLMPLQRGDGEPDSLLAHVLSEVSRHAEVYVLLWCGAPALFEPNRHMVEEIRRTLLRIAPRVRCALDFSAPFSHDQHQKAVTVDGRIAYVGGMDLTTFQGDRWDTAAHPLRFGPNWHDAQTRLQGEVVRDVEANFRQRWQAVTGESLVPLDPAPLDPAWQTAAQIVRTIPRGFYSFAPSGQFGIFHALTTAIRRAERFVYLENQYIWSPEVVEALMDAMSRPRATPLRVVLVLPAKAYTGKYDNDEHVRAFAKADAGRGFVHVYSLYASGPAIGATGFRHVPIYVHAKVAIVDDEWFSIGSANLNRRGLATDAEMNVHGIAPDVARSLRIRLWSEHLGLGEENVAAADPIDLIDRAWPETARSVEESIRSGAPPGRGQARRYIPGRNPGSRVLDAVQDLTLEH
ncbi:MAG TPA: phospholipase D family protein [Chloroflexota bacterium]|nr:phospholipase D family protein [Chloroflexota bacterium]